MKYILLIAVFFVINTKNIISQFVESNCFYDTINNITYNYNRLITYENYDDETVFFPEIINLNEKTYSFSDSLFLSAENLENVKLPKKISNDIFNVLYAHDIVNAWDLYDESGNDTTIVDDVVFPDNYKPRYKNRAIYLKRAKSKFKMYLLGNVEINKNFSSKLVLVDLKDKFRIKSLFLVNVKCNQLKSITLISYCFYPAGTCRCSDDLNFTSLGNGIFSQIGGLISFKRTIGEKELDYLPVFYYDDDAYLHVLKDCYITPWLTGKKYIY